MMPYKGGVWRVEALMMDNMDSPIEPWTVLLASDTHQETAASNVSSGY